MGTKFDISIHMGYNIGKYNPDERGKGEENKGR